MVTADGIELEAKALVFATGYELAKGVPAHGHRIASTWAFSTKPQPQSLWGKGELIWEAADLYLYIRTTADGRLIVGGEDEEFSDEAARDALLPAKIHALQEKTKALLLWIDVSADYSWAAVKVKPGSLPLGECPLCRTATRFLATAATASPSASWHPRSSPRSFAAKPTLTRSCLLLSPDTAGTNPSARCSMKALAPL
jgi:glycine/D-amino acid oxidase-like deaminating enzyme